MDWIMSIISHYNEITKLNPLVATLVIPLVGGLMFYLKNTPKQIWNSLVRGTTVTLTLNNAGYDGNIDAYHAFDKWFMQSGYKRFSRNFFMFRQYREDLFSGENFRPYRMGIGNGIHFFFYGYRFFWFNKGNLESSGSERQKEQITIRTFGWNSAVFENLIEIFNRKKVDDGSITIHTYNSSDRSWAEAGKVIGRDIETFCMNSAQKKEIIEKITNFTKRRDWYRKKGLTYKTSFLFFGPPGTGKTTLSKLLALNFKRDIYILDLSAMSNSMLVAALSTIKPGSFLLMEDVDQAGGAVRNRDKKKEEITLMDAMSEMGNLTMSGMLNAFDGVVSLDNLIIIMTTNKPEDLDAAIRRKSRIDNEYLIDVLTSTEIYEYVVQMYDGITDADSYRVLSFLSKHSVRLPGCEIENIFKEQPDSPMGFLDEIARRNNIPLPLDHSSVVELS